MQICGADAKAKSLAHVAKHSLACFDEARFKVSLTLSVLDQVADGCLDVAFAHREANLSRVERLRSGVSDILCVLLLGSCETCIGLNDLVRVTSADGLSEHGDSMTRS